MNAVKNAIVSCLEGFEAFWFDATEWNTVVRDKNGAVLPTRMLSDGQRTILSIVADIAYRCVTLNPELRDQATQATPGVVLIDEIDLHLHPKWQRRIVEDLRRTFPKIQFIATTHSPIILQNLDPKADKVIDLSGGDFPLTERSTPDDILKRMGLDIPQQSQAWTDFYNTAQRYYGLLEQAKSLNSANGHTDELQKLREELDQLSIPFEENPAWAALLTMQRIAAGTDRDNET